MKINHHKDQKEKEKKKRITLVEVIIIFTVLVIIGQGVYYILHWHETFDYLRQIGLVGSIALFVFVIMLRKWMDSW